MARVLLHLLVRSNEPALPISGRSLKQAGESKRDALTPMKMFLSERNCG